MEEYKFHCAVTKMINAKPMTSETAVHFFYDVGWSDAEIRTAKEALLRAGSVNTITRGRIHFETCNLG